MTRSPYSYARGLSIRPKTHRGVAGFLLYGRTPGSAWPTRIFTRTRAGAEKIRDAYRDTSLDREARERIVGEVLRSGA
jgi:hypothetical protein